MIITKKASSPTSFDLARGTRDMLKLEWYETNKRILHKQTAMGQKISIRFLQDNPDWKEGDIVFADDQHWISVEIIPCEAIVLTLNTIMEAAAVSYEIGNKHLPLFYQDDEILTPYEASLFKAFRVSGYAVEQAKRKLIKPLKTTLSHSKSSNSLFKRIKKLANGTE